MRERKFRGKRKDNDCWVSGGYFLHEDVSLCIASKEDIENNKKSLIIYDGMSDWNLSKPIQYIEVFHKSVGEFTGLKDKNGKDIYEGDMFQVAANNIYEVRYVNKGESDFVLYAATFVLWKSEEIFFPFDEYAIAEGKVIGNIYENPDLLK